MMDVKPYYKMQRHYTFFILEDCVVSERYAAYITSVLVYSHIAFSEKKYKRTNYYSHIS